MTYHASIICRWWKNFHHRQKNKLNAKKVSHLSGTYSPAGGFKVIANISKFTPQTSSHIYCRSVVQPSAPLIHSYSWSVHLAQPIWWVIKTLLTPPSFTPNCNVMQRSIKYLSLVFPLHLIFIHFQWEKFVSEDIWIIIGERVTASSRRQHIRRSKAAWVSISVGGSSWFIVATPFHLTIIKKRKRCMRWRKGVTGFMEPCDMFLMLHVVVTTYYGCDVTTTATLAQIARSHLATSSLMIWNKH